MKFTHWEKQLCIWRHSSILARKYLSGLCLPACAGGGYCDNNTSQPNWRLWLANWAELGKKENKTQNDKNMIKISVFWITSQRKVRSKKHIDHLIKPLESHYNLESITPLMVQKWTINLTVHQLVRSISRMKIFKKFQNIYGKIIIGISEHKVNQDYYSA